MHECPTCGDCCDCDCEEIGYCECCEWDEDDFDNDDDGRYDEGAYDA